MKKIFISNLESKPVFSYFQRFSFSEMSINQCQTGVDDNSEIPPEMFDTERVRIGRKGLILYIP